ncbi:MAG: glycosyl hydrolase family 18 protein [Bacteroidota bacterium]|jgi:chitinase
MILRRVVVTVLFFIGGFSVLRALEIVQTDSSFHVFAFYKGSEKDIDKYDIEKLTHIVFCFTHLKDNKIAIDNDEDKEILKRLVSLKKEHPNLIVLISFGGWGGCETCSDIFSTQSNRKEFAESVRAMILQYGADGLDVDWESPVIGGYKNHKAAKSDKENFTLLIKELRETLPASNELCFDANSFAEYLELSVDWKEIVPMVDFVNLMTYDVPSNLPNYAGHQASLYSSPYQTESVDKALHYLDSIRVPLNKIVIGAAFFAIAYDNVDSTNNGLCMPGKIVSYISYNKLEEKYLHNNDYTYCWDSTAQAPYLYSNKLRTFITFDDYESVRLKTKYAIRNHLGGIMFWRLNGDKPKNGLLESIYKEKTQFEK